jgi:hypothetical protein
MLRVRSRAVKEVKMILVFYERGTFYGEKGNFLLVELNEQTYSVYSIIRQTDYETLSLYKKSPLEWLNFKEEQQRRGRKYVRGRNKLFI